MHRFVAKCLAASWFVVAVVAVLSAVPSDVTARDGTASFKVGDKVTFTQGKDVVEGEVVAINPRNGWLTVRYTRRGHEMTMVRPPNRFQRVEKKPVRRAARSGGDAAAAEPPPEDDAMRTWTDATGKHKVEARFVELVDDNVRLEKSDGTTATLPVDKLCEADQRRVRRLARKTSTHETTTPGTAARPGDLTAPAPEAPQGDWSNVETVMIDTAAAGGVTPDSAIGQKLVPVRPFFLEMPKNPSHGASGRRNVTSMFPDREHHRLVVVSKEGGGQRAPELRVESCDLKAGKSRGFITIETSATPADLSPDGTLLACVSSKTNWPPETSAVEVWRLAKRPTLVRRWNADDPDARGALGTVDRVIFVPPGHLLTTSRYGGRITLWEIETARAVYSITASRRSTLASSANRKHLAVTSVGGIGILDAATGQTLTFLPGQSDPSAVLAFRPDGRQLAAISPQLLQVWDLETKRLVRDVALPAPAPNKRGISAERLDWVDDRHVLADGSWLIDVAKRVVLWRYLPSSGLNASVYVQDGTLYYLLSNMVINRAGLFHQSGLFFVAIPHPEAASVAARLSDDKVLAVRPGVQVALDIRVPVSDPGELKQITDSLTERLKANGATVVASGATITLEAVVEAGPSKTETYRGFGAGLGSDKTETVTVTEQISRLVFKENGRVLWQHETRSGGFAPAIVHHGKDESIQSAIDKRRGSPVWFFLNSPLPKYVARPAENGTYGCSMLTHQGCVPYPEKGQP